MSWVRVESFKGVRFSAPSFSQPPELEGFDRFFCSPHRMRTLHCFPPVRQAYRGENEVTVIFDQVDFGGRLGEVTIAVGDSSPSEAGLSVLMDAVIAALRSTNEAGVRAVLDGLCTLPPTVEERHAMTTVLEEDGIPRPLPLSHADTNSAHCSGERGNQEYMQKILSNANVARSNGNSGDRRHSSSAESMSNGYSSTSMLATSPALSSPDVLSHAEALRRKALLYFVAENVVPLSLLNCNVQLDRRKLATNTSITTPGDDRTLAGSMDATSLAPPPLIPTVVAHRCTSRLEKSEVLNRPQSFWRQIAVDASDSASRLVLALNRTLCGAFPGNDELFCRTMWRTDNPECSLENTPVVAAFSPSGLLLASPLFTTELEHRDRLIISAIAIDRLSRAGSLVEQESRAEDERGPASARLDAERRSCAILFLHLPFTIGVQVVELSFMTVGDSLCLVTGISQTLQRSRGLHITNIADLVRQNCSCFSSFKDSASFRCPLAANLSFQNDSLVTPLDHVINVCCNCTQPSSPHFFNSILVLTAMEENLADDVVGNSSLFEQLLLGDRDKFAADDIVRSTLPTERKKAKGLAKFLQCLPFCGRNSTSSWKKASQKLSAIRKKVHLFSDENTLATRSLDGDEVSLPKYQRQRRLSAVTSIPVHTSWCYVAAIYTRSELAAFRPLEGLGAHSIFWLTRSVDALAGGPSAKTKAANLPSLRLGQYALSFFRPQLQVITTSCADASMEIVHNPVLTLTMSSTSQGGGLGNTTPAQATTTPATGASAGASSAPAPADADDAAAEGGDAPLTFHAQVTLLPVELLEEEVCAPATADRTTGMDADGGNESIEDSESGFDDDDNVAAVDSADMLLTTFFLRYQQKMRSSKRARPRAAGGAGAGPSNASFSTERRASLSSASAAVMEDEKAGATGGTGTSSGKNKEKSKAPQKKGVISSMVGFGGDQGESYSWVTIEEIINLHGYLLGDEECIVASLQRRSAAVDKASRPKDGTLTELESSPQVRKLSEQLVLCQEAAHTMFEGVFNNE